MIGVLDNFLKKIKIRGKKGLGGREGRTVIFKITINMIILFFFNVHV